jgi:hypothetical protein
MIVFRAFFIILVSAILLVFFQIAFPKPNFEYDLCGVLSGQEDTCKSVLKSSGLTKNQNINVLRRELLDYINIHHKIMDPNDNTVPKRYVILDDEPEAGINLICTCMYLL